MSATPHIILHHFFFKNFAQVFFHGLKMCMCFGYNPCINFCHFVHFVIFWPQILLKCIDSGYLVKTTLHTILYRSFWNCAHVSTWSHGLEMCMDIILELFFSTFCRTCFSMGDLGLQVSVRSSVRSFVRPSTFTLGVFSAPVCQHLPWVSCERNFSYSFIPIILKLCKCFRHGMRLCMWFGYNC